MSGIKEIFVADINVSVEWQKIFKKHKRELIKDKIKKLYNL